jgi:nucleotide-binding universal stress UspA family protein
VAARTGRRDREDSKAITAAPWEYLMNSNVLLAVDVVGGRPQCSADAAAQLACELVRDTPGQVVVLYVREFSVLRLGQMMADHGGSAGQHAVDKLVAGLRAGGVAAGGLVREAEAGHVAQAIIDAARETGARVIVLGAGVRPGPLHLPAGRVAARVLHRATLPVLIVPGPADPVPAAAAAS